MVKRFTFDGQKHFYGDECALCGGTIRYKAKLNRCVACNIARAKKYRESRSDARVIASRRYAREYYKRNRQTMNARSAKWQKDNPDRHAVFVENYRAKEGGI